MLILNHSVGTYPIIALDRSFSRPITFALTVIYFALPVASIAFIRSYIAHRSELRAIVER